jgi:hypothetical protein
MGQDKVLRVPSDGHLTPVEAHVRIVKPAVRNCMAIAGIERCIEAIHHLASSSDAGHIAHSRHSAVLFEHRISSIKRAFIEILPSDTRTTDGETPSHTPS